MISGERKRKKAKHATINTTRAVSSLTVVASCLVLMALLSFSCTAAMAAVFQNIHTIQVAAFSSRQQAHEEVRQLRGQGFSPFILGIYDLYDKLWYTVHVGHYASLVQAQAVADDFYKVTGQKALIFSRTRSVLTLFEGRLPGEYQNRFSVRAVEQVETVQKHAKPVEELGEVTTQVTQVEENEVEVPFQEEQVAGEEPVDLTAEQSQSTQERSPSPPNQYYVLASLGISHLNKDSTDLDNALANQGIKIVSYIDNVNLGWKIVGGYRVNQHLAVEAGYVYFQNANTQISTATMSTDIVREIVKSAPLSMRGGIVEGVGLWDVMPDISLVGKAGGFFWSSEINANYQSVIVKRDEKGIDLVLGLGAEFHVFDKQSLRLEYERFFTPDHMDYLSVGLKMGF